MMDALTFTKTWAGCAAALCLAGGIYSAGLLYLRFRANRKDARSTFERKT
ncbi:MAG: hypothetical protein ABIW76_24540 [Fibrobacteria bacterium]